MVSSLEITKVQNDYSLNIEGNTITGDSTDYIISVNNNTAQASRGVEGGGSGDITISRNKIEVDDIKQLPIYINDDTTYVASVIDRTTGKTCQQGYKSTIY